MVSMIQRFPELYPLVIQDLAPTPGAAVAS